MLGAASIRAGDGDFYIAGGMESMNLAGILLLPRGTLRLPAGQRRSPMVEKSGSDDAFRFFIHAATGGSDHICFNNPSVAVPGIEFFVWPDQWYHTDHDTPDKGDATEMKRVGFIGAASAWAAANCTDEVLPGTVGCGLGFRLWPGR